MDGYALKVLNHFFERNPVMWGVCSGILGISDDGSQLYWVCYNPAGFKAKIVVAMWVAGTLIIRDDETVADVLRDVTDGRYSRIVNAVSDYGKRPGVFWVSDEISDDLVEQWKLVIATKGIGGAP